MAVDQQGTVYVADNGSGHVLQFSAGGRLLAQWGPRGLAGGPFQKVTALTVSHQSTVFVADGDGSIREFSTTGHLLAQTTVDGVTIMALATDTRGDVYVADQNRQDTGDLQNIQEMTPAGALLATWNVRALKSLAAARCKHGRAHLSTLTPTGLTIDSQGHVFVALGATCAIDDVGPADELQSTVQEIAPNGKGLTTHWSTWWAPRGDALWSLGVDTHGDVYGLDRANGQIVELSSRGKLLAQRSIPGAGLNGQFGGPGGLAVDVRGDIYVADTNNSRVEKLSAQGT